jgi:PAS domain S-box-containing protein
VVIRSETGRAVAGFPSSVLVSLAGAVALLPLLLLLGYGIALEVAAGRQEELDRLERYSGSLARSLDRELKSFTQKAEIMAASRFLKGGDVATMGALTRDAAERIGGHFVIVDRTGQHLVNTALPPDAPLGRTTHLQSLEDAVAAGRPIIYDLLVGTVTQRQQFGVLAPVVVDGVAKYVLVYVPRSEALQKLVQDILVPQGWLAAILDRNGRIVARSEGYERFFGQEAAPSFLSQISSAGGLVESTDLQGRSAYTAYRVSKLSGWRAVVWAPRAAVDVRGGEAFRVMAGAVVAALLLSVIAGQLVSRLFRVPVQHLVSAARALGNGAAVPPVASRMLEANVVAAALLEASEKIARRERDLARTTDRVRESEERLRIATDAAGLGVFEWRGTDAEAVFENERMCEILGHESGEGRLGKDEFLRAYLHPEDAERLETSLFAGTDAMSSFRLTCRIRRKSDGVWRWIDCAGNLRRDASGGPARLVGVVADITERKRAEDELLRSTALLRAVSDGASDMIFVKDVDSRLIFANPATVRVCGRPIEGLIGTTGVEWGLDPAEVESFLANDRKVIETGTAMTVEEAFTGPIGRRTFLSEKAPLRDADGRIVGLIGVSRDITDRKQEEERTRLLLREVSHRAKNMLAVTQAIIRQTAHDLDPGSFAERVSERLAGLAVSHDLLVASDWHSVAIHDLVHAQLAHCHDLIGTRIRIGGPQVRLRPSATQTLGMAIHELATNASKYGALSGGEGNVALTWQIDGRLSDQRLVMEWEESGGPPVAEPGHRGFGHAVLVRMVRQGLDAEVELAHRPGGLSWRVTAPMATVRDPPVTTAPGTAP